MGCFSFEGDIVQENNRERNLLRFLSVRNTGEYFSNYQRLKQMNEEMGFWSCSCCIGFNNCLFGGTLVAASKYDKYAARSAYKLGGCSLLACIISPFLCSYQCCESCLNCCYQKTTRIHELFVLYEEFQSRIVEREN